jgi:murein DD-endopeptidase MepM/ murein hydrolase activator NlpD
MRGPGRRPGPARRSRLNWKRVFLVFVGAPAVLVLLVLLAVNIVFPPAGREPERAVEPAPTVAAEPAPPVIEEEKIIIPRGANLAVLLKEKGFDNRQIHDLKESAKPVYDLARIISGHELRLYTRQDGPWQGLEYDIDETRYVAVRNEPGGITAAIKSYPFEVRPALVYGIIESSPIAAMNKVGEDDILALELAERCFGWDIDFYTDLRKDDTFRILVEKKYLNGRFSGYRNILAAEFVNDGTVFQAFRYVYPDTGEADYFDETGFSKRKEFLKSPFKFSARITSRFSSSRRHPILKIYRPHYGVDYAAPIGTPVQATADGTVTFAGWNGGSGRMVRLRHKNSYETLYLHLSRLGPGIRKGASVRGGDVVGYVGSSGESTGPHLDYRIYYHGSPVNPLSQKFKPAEPVRKEYLESYSQSARRLRLILDAPAAIEAAVIEARRR